MVKTQFNPSAEKPNIENSVVTSSNDKTRLVNNKLEVSGTSHMIFSPKQSKPLSPTSVPKMELE